MVKASRPRMTDLSIAATRVSSRNRRCSSTWAATPRAMRSTAPPPSCGSTGVHNALINIGGNVMALGSKGGQPWRVGIQHPRAAAPLATLELRDGEAIGTSGDYQRYFELDGGATATCSTRAAAARPRAPGGHRADHPRAGRHPVGRRQQADLHRRRRGMARAGAARSA
jgi:hypothetical protein